MWTSWNIMLCFSTMYSSTEICSYIKDINDLELQETFEKNRSYKYSLKALKDMSKEMRIIWQQIRCFIEYLNDTKAVLFCKQLQSNQSKWKSQRHQQLLNNNLDMVLTKTWVPYRHLQSKQRLSFLEFSRVVAVP